MSDACSGWNYRLFVVAGAAALGVVGVPEAGVAKRMVEGRIVDAKGAPPGGYRVRIYDADSFGPDDLMGIAYTNGDGR